MNGDSEGHQSPVIVASDMDVRIAMVEDVHTRNQLMNYVEIIMIVCLNGVTSVQYLAMPRK
jgi:hypothetical protein